LERIEGEKLRILHAEQIVVLHPCLNYFFLQVRILKQALRAEEAMVITLMAEFYGLEVEN
jgi:hypothetical protein